MLPDWDFGDDEAKRRAFISWVWAELDRFEGLTAGRFDHSPELPDDWLEAARAHHARKKPNHRPVLSTAAKLADSSGGAVKTYNRNGALWEYALLRWMFERYWPDKTRSEDDPANPLHIAVARNRLALRPDLRAGDRSASFRVHFDETGREYARKLKAAWKKRGDNPGLVMAREDIAYLETLPEHLFPH